MNSVIGWDGVVYVEEFVPLTFNTLDRELSLMEKLVVDWARVDRKAGIGWTGIRSRCWWTLDGRRVTLTLHDVGGGHTVRISMQVDPRFLEGKEEAA